MKTDHAIVYGSVDRIDQLLGLMSQSADVVLPHAAATRKGNETYHYEPYRRGDSFMYYGFRPGESLKSFLFGKRMKVAEYPSKAGESDTAAGSKTVVAGAAACDLAALRTLDTIFLDEAFTDIFYRDRRNSLFVISADCTCPRETCFCTMMKGKPHAESGFDLNLSRLADGFIIESGSDAGDAVLKEHGALFAEPSGGQLDERDRIRAMTIRMVEEQNSAYALTKPFRELLGLQRESTEWYEHVSTCVECGACLFSCPTCHCFLLYDQRGESGVFRRFREWDVCIYAGYSRMAGGSSPRLGLMERFRHRYLHKLEYIPTKYGFEACSGCGRCIEGCMGKIDMRKVLKALDDLPVGVGGKQ